MENIFWVMHTTDAEGMEFVSYQLINIAYQWYGEWEQLRGDDVESALWDNFSSAFIGRFVPQKLREAKDEGFLNLKQDRMMVKKYVLKFY